jgi:rubrerythrin
MAQRKNLDKLMKEIRKEFEKNYNEPSSPELPELPESGLDEQIKKMRACFDEQEKEFAEPAGQESDTEFDDQLKRIDAYITEHERELRGSLETDIDKSVTFPKPADTEKNE